MRNWTFRVVVGVMSKLGHDGTYALDLDGAVSAPKDFLSFVSRLE